MSDLVVRRFDGLINDIRELLFILFQLSFEHTVERPPFSREISRGREEIFSGKHCFPLGLWG